MELKVQNYTFVKNDYDADRWGLREGAGAIGTMTSYGWRFDGQVFVKTEHRGKYDPPVIVKVYKKKTPQ